MTATAEHPQTGSALDVRPVAGHIGAEIHGVDLRHALDDATVAAIRAALLRHKVVFFRDQPLDHDQQIAFTARFGKVTPAHPYRYDNGDAGRTHPEILAVDSRLYAARAGARRYSYASFWHTDVAALVNPPAATVLRSEIVPPYGGDTTWTNLVAAYEGLPEPLQRFVEGLRAEHRFGGRAPRWENGSESERLVAEAPIVSEHPVVRVHPETGERALFVSPGFTSRIVGFAAAQSDRLLDLLFDEITNPAYTVRFGWRPDSVGFWDNRVTAHLAPTDLDHLDVTRVLYRTTIEGDVPVGVDGVASRSISGEAFRAAGSRT
ncbi:taurine dioxygenase (plasmid) [Pseudonocardia sp. EC080610-09]|uniref:TauD/TfdA dioxygenase family protein n=1 Tax=unclassified Pseudonocardia TaxID=2619320 RepID=UPI000705E36F|nr:MULTISPECIES: TauD/TfdA family dioxygenase [unclassified Pseudonocardia]ALL79440.1 taurine dioxygenase [Pseudonocardia sp. EC080610-09]ALL85607.1 taurine dioxygenase [Pseudonocardia sp. EC080619-01]